VRYRNGALGVLDVSLKAEAAQVVAIFGANGAGKTTTVRAISGFLKTEGARIVGGRVTLFGQDTTNFEPHDTARLSVAFVPERRKIFPNLTVSENLDAVGRLPGRGRRAEIYDRVLSLFPMLVERRREFAGRLSGGQQQMLAIARGLIREPKLLIVDEMTLGLHQSLHAPLFEVVQRIAAQGTTIIVVDESAGLVLHISDYCYLLGSGRVRDEGPAERFRGNELLATGYVDST
jgi:branched-chain amino acid transport system ATP-binding protein